MKSLYTGLFLSAALAGASAAEQQAVNGLRVVVNDSVITERQVRASADDAIRALRLRYADQPDVYLQKHAETMQNAMEALVDRQLLIQDFKKSGFAFPENVLDDMVQASIVQDFGSRAKMAKTLHAEGLTQEKYRQRIRERVIIDFLQRKNVSQEIIISPHKIAAFYEANRDKFKVEEQVKLRMIVLDATASATLEGRKKMADEILTLLRGGADFAQLAQVHSTGSQRRQGGDMGDPIGRSVLRKELADVAFGLEPKKPSPVIETPDACYLLWVEAKHPAHVRPLGEVRDDIEKTLLIDERGRLQKKYVEKLKNKTFIRYF